MRAPGLSSRLLIAAVAFLVFQPNGFSGDQTESEVNCRAPCDQWYEKCLNDVDDAKWDSIESEGFIRGSITGIAGGVYCSDERERCVRHYCINARERPRFGR